MKQKNMERSRKEESVDIETLYRRLLERRMFPWKNKSTTIGQTIVENSGAQARKTLELLKQEANLEASSVIEKIKGRAETWNYTEYLSAFVELGRLSLSEFSDIISNPLNTSGQNDNAEAKKWVLNNLSSETARMLRRSRTASRKLRGIRQKTVDLKIRNLKKEKADGGYSDYFDKAVCQTADRLRLSLPDAEKIVRQKIDTETNDADIENYLRASLREQKEKKLKTLLLKNIKKTTSQEKAVALTSVRFGLEQFETDKVWGADKLDAVLIAGLNGEKINLISMTCLINQFDYKGGYFSNPNLFAYLNNPKLEPVPLVVDEMAQLPEFFGFYGIRASLTIYVSDTGYSEIGEFGPVDNVNIRNIKAYVENLKNYTIDKPAVAVIPISNITDNNPLYNEVKARVLKNVASFKDLDFTREWNRTFENDFEKRFESQTKRKLFPPDKIRNESLKLTRNIWACNAGQGTVFATLSKNTILVSTERRERDRNYTIDRGSRENFPPILYILSVAESWNRKIVQKGT